MLNFGAIMTVEELIKELQRLEQDGYGQSSVCFDYDGNSRIIINNIDVNEDNNTIVYVF